MASPAAGRSRPQTIDDMNENVLARRVPRHAQHELKVRGDAMSPSDKARPSSMWQARSTRAGVLPAGGYDELDRGSAVARGEHRRRKLTVRN
jgi:hypothetical protein